MHRPCPVQLTLKQMHRINRHLAEVPVLISLQQGGKLTAGGRLADTSHSQMRAQRFFLRWKASRCQSGFQTLMELPQGVLRIIEPHPQDAWARRMGETAECPGRQSAGDKVSRCMLHRLGYSRKALFRHLPKKF